MKKTTIVLIMIILLSALNPQIILASSENEKKVVMLIVDNINYEDLVNFGGDNIKHILESSTLGLMNTNTGSGYTDSNAYATIGAGSYAISSAFGNCSGGYDDTFYLEPFNIVYKRHTGRQMELDNIVNVDISSLRRNNERLNRPVQIGLLGSKLNEFGLKTAIIGNENRSLDEINVNAALITMDEYGKTDMGKVNNNLLQIDPYAPFGLRTDYAALYNTYLELKNRANFIVIQTGDTFRLNKYTYLSDEAYEENKVKIFNDIDQFLGKILNTLHEESMLILCVPFPSREDSASGKRLTPLLIHEKELTNGILASATTKRDGIVTNTDIAAHILHFFDIDKVTPMSGHKLQYVQNSDPLGYLLDLNDISVFNYRTRAAVVKTFIGCIIGVLLLSVVSMVYLKRLAIYIQPLLTAILITPTLFLLLPLFNPWSITRLSVSIIITAILSSAVLTYIAKDKLNLFTISCLLSAGIIVLDTFLKNPLMKVSIFGYDPIAGARFYGIGNEFMGYLIGTTIIGTTALVDKYKGHETTTKLISTIIYGIVLFTLASPALGTNVGGAMASFISFCTAIILLFRGKITLRELAILAILLVIFLLGLFIYDGLQPSESQSHIGQTSALVKQNRAGALLQIFGRKLSMNYKLIRYSNWTLVLLATIGSLGIIFRWPMGILKEIFRENKHLYFGFMSGIVGTLSAFAFNDSGVVAAAMAMIPITIPLIMLCIDKMAGPNKAIETEE